MRQRSRPLWSATLALTTTPIAIYLGSRWEQVKIEVDARAFASLGAAYTPPAVGSVAAVTTVRSTGTPTGGGFNLILFPGDRIPAKTGLLAYNASAATIKSGVTGILPAVAASADIAAAGGALPTDVTLTWAGVYKGEAPQMSVDSTGLVSVDNARIQLIQAYAESNGGYGYLPASAQEFWTASNEGVGLDRYLYLATVASTGNAYVTLFG